MADSRPTSLYRGMRNHPPPSEGEEMSQVLSVHIGEKNKARYPSLPTYVRHGARKELE